MTTTAGDIVEFALGKIGVKRAGRAVTNQEMADGIEELNDLVTEMEADEIIFGYTQAETKTTDITIPDWTRTCLKYNLAVRLASSYGMRVAPEVRDIAEKAKNIVRDRLFEVPIPHSSPAMPVGEGNAYLGDSRRFFLDETTDDLSFADGNPAEDETGEQLEIDEG